MNHEEQRIEEAAGQTKKRSDRTLVLIGLGFAVALGLLIVLNMR